MLIRVILALALGLSTAPIGLCALLCGPGTQSVEVAEPVSSCCAIQVIEACAPETMAERVRGCGGEDDCRACELVCPRLMESGDHVLPPLNGGSWPAQSWAGGVDYEVVDAGAARVRALERETGPPGKPTLNTQSVTCVWLI